MGSSASKVSRTAGATARQYPKRPPPTSQATTSNATPPRQPPSNQAPGPNVRPQPYASEAKSEAVNFDASDPDFAQSLRSLGPVQPNPTMSPSSAFPNSAAQTSRPLVPDARQNPALVMLDARSRLQGEADREFMDAGKRGHEGRRFLDVLTIRQILILRDQRGESSEKIEKMLGLKKGVVDRLGAKGVVGLAQEMDSAQREINMV